MKASSLLKAAGALTVALLAFTPPAPSQTAEALMEVLVRKGILTEQEAEDIKVELAKENAEVNKVKAPNSTISKIDLYGDFRGRFEGFYADHDDWNDRNRWRYRARVGLRAHFYERFEAGVRLISSDSDARDPISGNSTMRDNASKKYIFIDQAYLTWTAVTNVDYLGNLTFGKMENPFTLSSLLFDSDYTPEGLASQWKYSFDVEQSQVLALNLGGFVLDELSGDSDDPYLLGAQARWNSTWLYNKAFKPKLGTSLGIAALLIGGEENLTSGAVPDSNLGNTRQKAAGDDYDEAYPGVNFNPIVVDGAITYWLDSVPYYNGFFPIALTADYLNNLAISEDNQGYSVGVKFGKSGKKATWDLGYEWRYLEGDAWYEELVDSDFGAYYASADPDTWTSSRFVDTGYGAGTNVKGHVVKLNYSPYNALTLGVTYFYTKLIDEPASADGSDMHRVQVDALVKF